MISGLPQSLTTLLLRQYLSSNLELINSAAPAGQQAQCLLSLLCQHWHCKQVPGFSCQVLEIKLRFSGLCSQHFTDRAIFLASIFWLWLVLWDQVWNFAPGHPCSRRMSSGSRLSKPIPLLCNVSMSPHDPPLYTTMRHQGCSWLPQWFTETCIKATAAAKIMKSKWEGCFRSCWDGSVDKGTCC